MNEIILLLLCWSHRCSLVIKESKQQGMTYRKIMSLSRNKSVRRMIIY